MRIRDAKVKDAADIALIHLNTWRIAYAGIVPNSHLNSLSLERLQKHWENTLTQSIGNTIVAVTEDEQVIGWAFFGPSRDKDGVGYGELYAIYLDSDYWGKGYGQELIFFAIEHLKKKGLTTITLWVLEKNKRTIRFYEKAGFKPDGGRKSINIGGIDLVEIRFRNNN